MFIIALQLCFVYEPYEGLGKFQCCFSVSFHPSNTRWRGCQSYQRSQKNQLPYGTLWNHCIYNHALIYAYHLPLPWAYGIGNPYFIALIFAFLVTKRILIFRVGHIRFVGGSNYQSRPCKFDLSCVAMAGVRDVGLLHGCRYNGS